MSDDEASPDHLANRMNSYARERRSARDMGEMLVRLGRYARSASPAERAAVEQQMRTLVSGLSSEALAWLFTGQNVDERRSLMTEAVDTLPVDTVVELLKAASASGDENTISHFMLRMLRKLAGQAKSTGDVGVQGDTELRDAAREIVDNWTLDDPNPLEHTRLLDSLSRFEVSKTEGTAPLTGEGLRLMQIAVETNSSGDHVLEAIELMLESRELVPLLDLLASAPDAPDTVQLAWRHLASPEILRRVLLEEPIDAEGSQRLLEQVGPDGAGGLLDALVISESQGTRRLILERLAAMGPAIAGILVERLPRTPWYVQRNLLALLARLKSLPAGFSAAAIRRAPRGDGALPGAERDGTAAEGTRGGDSPGAGRLGPARGATRARCGGGRPPATGRHAAHAADQQRRPAGGASPAGHQAAGEGPHAGHPRLAPRACADQARTVSRLETGREVDRKCWLPSTSSPARGAPTRRRRTR